MTNKLQCPFCGGAMETFDGDFHNYYRCLNAKCSDKYGWLPEELLLALIQAKQDLEIATKALEKLKECLFQGGEQSVKLGVRVIAQAALEQIEHKE
jgi:hypothetical protein